MSLDAAVALRQTMARSYRQKDVDALLAGKLAMAPHPEWTLPETPTWREDPFHDRNWQFQFHTLRWLEPLRRAAAKGDDAAYEMWLRWVRDWVAQNPPQSPQSRWAWADMADGVRALHLCQAVPVVEKRSPELLERLELAIRTHAEHLADPAHMGKANHALHQVESLFVCGRVLGDERLWRLAMERMSALLFEQYDEQGMNAEGAVAYHHNNVLWWERALKRVKREKLERPSGAERLDRAHEGIAHATRPDGTYVTIGDTDAMTPEALEAQHPATDYVWTKGRAGKAPASTTALYEAGWVFARSGWGDADRPYADQSYYTVRFGPSRRVHGHADGTSVTLSARGVNWVVDPGKYDYSTSTPRLHFVSRAAHSVMTLDGHRLQNRAQVDLVRRTFAASHHDLLLTDSSFGRANLTRRIVWSTSGEYMVVIDEANTSRAVRALQRWQLGPEVEARIDGQEVHLRSGDRVALISVVVDGAQLSAVRGQESPFDGWVSAGWRKKVEATAITAQIGASSPRIVTVLVPAAGKGVAAPHVRPLDGAAGPSMLTLEVGNGLLTERIVISEEEVVITPVSSDGAPGSA